jgi:hypothetical protein
MTYNELVTAVQDYCENTFPTADMNTMIRQAEQTIYNTVQIANLRKNVTGSLTVGNKYLNAPNDFLSVYSVAVYPYATPTATGTSGQSTIVVSSSTGISAGMYVSGTGIATGATVVSVVGTTVTLSAANSGTVSGTVTFQGEYLYLINKDVNFLREAYPSAMSTGMPKYYAIFGPVYGLDTELSFMVGPTPDTTYGVELHYYYYPLSITDPASGYTTWLGDNFDSALFNATMMEAITYMKGERDLVELYTTRYAQSVALLKNLGDGKQRMDAYRDGQVRNPVK